MTVGIITIDSQKAAAREMRALGADPAGIALMAPKAVQRVIKLTGIKPVAANIIKQEMLSFGGEAANAYGSINHSVKTTDLLIFGTLKQLSQLTRKLQVHQFGLPGVGCEIAAVLERDSRPPAAMMIGGKLFTFGKRTYIMGVLNVTPDSFSDGGRYSDPAAATAEGKKLIAEGADIIDVGGESTRPGAKSVSLAEELRRVVPVISALARETKAIISIDTRKARVAEAAIKAGVRLVNAVSFDKQMARVVARAKVPVCLMHMKGEPGTMQENPTYTDLLCEVIASLEESLAIAGNAGILHGKIIVDPGIGFGKTVAHNIEIVRRLRELKALGCPILVGPSRKSLIGKILRLPVAERVEGTAAVVALAIANGADLVRVHDVKQMVRVARMTDAIVRRG